MPTKNRRVSVVLGEGSEQDLTYIKKIYEYGDSAAIRISIRQYARILRLQDGGCEA